MKGSKALSSDDHVTSNIDSTHSVSEFEVTTQTERDITKLIIARTRSAKQIFVNILYAPKLTLNKFL